MRRILLSLAFLLVTTIAHAEPFEIKDGDRVLFLGDTLLEREGTYGYLETRMVEQFPDRKFTVRNLAFSADTPLGWSRASFDPAAKGFERLKEQLALVKPTVVFLGYGMAASLQEMTDRSQDWTLNRDPARYGAEPMSAARFKKELAQCMDAIAESGRAGFQPAVPGILPGTPKGERPAQRDTPSGNGRTTTPGAPGKIPGAAGGTPALPDANPVRFVLLSPIGHDDLRETRPGTPDPMEHNKLIAQYSQAIEELAKERGARFVSLLNADREAMKAGLPNYQNATAPSIAPVTDNGIHLNELGYELWSLLTAGGLGWGNIKPTVAQPLRAAIIRKNALFFHRWRPANETYLFGFRKREQGQNAVEIPKFDPLIEAAEAEIERLKKTASAQSSVPSAQTAASPAPVTSHQPPVTPAPFASQPHPTFTLADGLEISLWAENPFLAKPTQMNWDAQGRLWVASSAMYPQIAPGQAAFDKIIVLEDNDRDGKAEKSTVFVDGLLIPTGVAPVLVQAGSAQFSVPSAQKDAAGATSSLSTDRLSTEHSAHRWACYVGQSTELLYFEDTDGDGKADKKRIVFSGFGTEDTHHIVHTLRWGPDGRLYFSQSVYIHTHMETPWGVVRVNSGGVFAYDPRTERVEVVEKGLWNTWGHAWDQWGQSFYTDGAGSTGLSWGFPGATFAPNEGARRTMASISPGSYPKFAGLEIIYSPHFPAEWQGTAVTCDFRAHKIVHFKINDLGSNAETQRRGEEGNSTVPPAAVTPGAAIPPSSSASSLRLGVSALKSGYVTEQLPVLVQTSDATFRPIDVKLGPDGAIYIADWSNPIINHGEVDFRDPRRDHEHGRIWRLSRKGGAAVKWDNLVGKKLEEVIAALHSENDWSREQARRIINVTDADNWDVKLRDAREKLSDGREDVGNKAYHRALLESEWLYNNKPVHFDDWSPLSILNMPPPYGSWITNSVPEKFAMFARLIGPAADRNNTYQKANREQALKKSPALSKAAEQVDTLTAKMNEAREIEKRLREQIVAKTDAKQDTASLKAELKALKSRMMELDEKTHELRPLVSPVRLKSQHEVLSELGLLAGYKHPRVRVEAMRALARTPTIESASLILDAAINAPKDDPQYDFAAWVSINDLADVWTKAVLAGEWKPEGREKQFEFALNAIEPALAGQVLSQFVSTGRAPLDGSGPWIELIGNTGGPAELRRLLDGLLAATIPDGDKIPPLADAKHKFKVPGTNARAAAALVAAARRGVKPAGVPLGDWRFYFYAPEDAIADVVRLSGLWKENVTNAIGAHIGNNTDAKLLDACFESLRLLGTGEAAKLTAAYLGVNLGGKPDDEFVRHTSGNAGPAIRRRALIALATLRPAEAGKQLGGVLASVGEQGHLQLWRDLFASPPFVQRFSQATPKDLPQVAYASAMRAAREMGRKGDGLANKLAPLAGESTAKVAPADYNDLAARAKQHGDPVAGEAMYRRMASACTTCHAIGGAGGKLGPDMTSIGASAPADYLIESILNPAAKVKEGYHAFTFTMKDGSEAIGIPTRDTPQEQFIRTLAGEQGIPKANIVSKKITEGGASLMPAGLVNSWTDRERLNLYAFLMELGRPGPFDASKNNVARVWQLTEVERVAPRTLPGEETRDGATRSTTPAIYAYTLVDGRLTKDLLAEKLAMLAPKNATVHLTAHFRAASAGKAKLNLTGIRKAWLDGQPLAIASEPSPSVDLTAGEHTFTVEVDAKSPPEVVRVESGAVSFLGD